MYHEKKEFQRNGKGRTSNSFLFVIPIPIPGLSSSGLPNSTFRVRCAVHLYTAMVPYVALVLEHFM